MKFLTLVLVGSLFVGSTSVSAQNASGQCVPSDQVELQQTMRKLWTDHVFWTRLYIISAISKSADTPVVTSRLLKNQDEIGATLTPFYGKNAAATLTQLLREHILISAELVNAVLAKAKDDVKKADQKWHDNAVAIADFLSKANSNWTKQDLVDMLNRHLTLTTQEVTYRIEKKWPQDISNFDQILDQALDMADTFSSGISYQFLEKKQNQEQQPPQS